MRKTTIIFKPEVEQPREMTDSYFDRRFAYIGMVVDHQPENNTVSVRMDTGRIIPGVRVASQEWITEGGDDRYKHKELTGEKWLPPLNSVVLCLMPNGNPSNSICICSVYGMQSNIHSELKDKKLYIKKRIGPGGWKFEENTETGQVNIENESGNVKLEILEDDDGINLNIDGPVKLEFGDETDIKISKKVKIELDDSIEIMGKTGKLKLGNSIETLGAMMSDLLEALIQFQSVGSPANHTSPGLTAAATAIKAKWTQVFE